MLGSRGAFEVQIFPSVLHWWCTAIDYSTRRVDNNFWCFSILRRCYFSFFLLSSLSTIVLSPFPLSSQSRTGGCQISRLQPTPKGKQKKNRNVWKNARTINYSACCCIVHGKCVNQNPIEKVKVPSSNFVRTWWLPRTARVEGYQLWLPCAATQLPRRSILRPNIRWWTAIPSNFRYRIKQPLGTSTKLQFLR